MPIYKYESYSFYSEQKVLLYEVKGYHCINYLESHKFNLPQLIWGLPYS